MIKIKTCLALCFFVIFISSVSIVSAQEVGEEQNLKEGSNLQIVDRAATADYYVTEKGDKIAIVYPIVVNMKDIASGKYSPYNETTRFYSEDGNLVLEWNDKSVIFDLYIKDYENKRTSIRDLSFLERFFLNFKTSISSNKGMYYYNHTLNKNRQPAVVGYDLITKNVECRYLVGEYALVCDEQKISFSDAINIQGLDVNINAKNVEFSGGDLSYIDPIITLNAADVFRSWGVWYDSDIDDYFEDEENGGSDELRVGTDAFTGGHENHRAYMAFFTDDINETWTITSIDYNIYASFIDDAYSATLCDNLEFYEQLDDYVSDWTPDDSIEAAEIWNALDDRHRYELDVSVDEDQMNVESFDNAADRQLKIDTLNGDQFFIGIIHGSESTSDDCYVELAKETTGFSNRLPSLVITYTEKDLTPPTTSISATSPPGGSSYSFGAVASDNVRITLGCTDNGGGSGCKIGYPKYCLSTTGTCSPATTYTGEINISAGGVSYITYNSLDKANNTESLQTQQIIIDKNHPNNVSLKIKGSITPVWEETSIFAGKESTEDFATELNSALSACVADALGYCDIPFTIHSDTSGRVNITNINIFYNISDYTWNVSALPLLTTYKIRIQADDGLLESDWDESYNDFIIGGVSVPEDTNKFYVRNSTGSNLAWFGDLGNVVLKGSCFVQSVCNATDGSWIIGNSTDSTVAYINSTGDLCIEKGDCSDFSASCNPTRNAFVVKDTSANNVSYIDFNGDLCLTGELFENEEI